MDCGLTVLETAYWQYQFVNFHLDQHSYASDPVTDQKYFDQGIVQAWMQIHLTGTDTHLQILSDTDKRNIFFQIQIQQLFFLSDTDSDTNTAPNQFSDTDTDISFMIEIKEIRHTILQYSYFFFNTHTIPL